MLPHPKQNTWKFEKCQRNFKIKLLSRFQKKLSARLHFFFSGWLKRMEIQVGKKQFIKQNEVSLLSVKWPLFSFFLKNTLQDLNLTFQPSNIHDFTDYLLTRSSRIREKEAAFTFHGQSQFCHKLRKAHLFDSLFENLSIEWIQYYFAYTYSLFGF